AESYKKAAEHQRVAYLHAPQVERYRRYLSKHYFNYGRVLGRRLGRPDEAARVALARKELWSDDPHRLFAVAKELALASELLRGSMHGDMTSEQCAAYAVETLEEAAKLGLELPEGFDETEPFAQLKGHPGFAGLVGK
ncbi:MAG: hypothetical protein HQ582_28490, partial [Planctomycetes bacterium]|nr:hypothetical protein [Planctomycetota bacterium]